MSDATAIDGLPKELVEWHLRHAEVQREQRLRLRRLSKERREARERARAAAAKAKRHASRQPIACASCGEAFVPVRTDSLYCSNSVGSECTAPVTDNKHLAIETFISRYA
jgi:hypothetical protein